MTPAPAFQKGRYCICVLSSSPSPYSGRWLLRQSVRRRFCSLQQRCLPRSIKPRCSQCNSPTAAGRSAAGRRCDAATNTVAAWRRGAAITGRISLRVSRRPAWPSGPILTLGSQALGESVHQVTASGANLTVLSVRFASLAALVGNEGTLGLGPGPVHALHDRVNVALDSRTRLRRWLDWRLRAGRHRRARQQTTRVLVARLAILLQPGQEPWPLSLAASEHTHEQCADNPEMPHRGSRSFIRGTIKEARAK